MDLAPCFSLIYQRFKRKQPKNRILIHSLIRCITIDSVSLRISVRIDIQIDLRFKPIKTPSLLINWVLVCIHSINILFNNRSNR